MAISGNSRSKGCPCKIYISQTSGSTERRVDFCKKTKAYQLKLALLPLLSETRACERPALGAGLSVLVLTPL